jgi:hypothetical protein
MLHHSLQPEGNQADISMMRRQPEEGDIVERAEKQENGTQKEIKGYGACILFPKCSYGNY